MRVAVADRPVEQFTTQVELPQWQLEDDNQAYFGDPADGSLVDENGLPVEQDSNATGEPQFIGDPVDPENDNPDPMRNDPPKLDRRWIDEQTGAREATPRAPTNGEVKIQ